MNQTKDPTSTFSVIHTSPGFAIINKPFHVPMDSSGDNTSPVTVQSWVESENGGKKMLKDAMFPYNSDVQQQQNENEDKEETAQQKSQQQHQLPTNRRNTKDAIDGKMRFVHQLDFATSGLLCLAFSKRLAAKVIFCFETRLTRKEYLAILDGWVVGPQQQQQQHQFTLTQQVKRKMIPLSEIAETLRMTNPKVSEKLQQEEEKENNSNNRILISFPVGKDATDPKEFKMRAAETQRYVRIRQRNGEDDDVQQQQEQQQQLLVSNPKPASTILTVLSHGFLKSAADDCNNNKDKSSTVPDKTRPVTFVHLQLLTGRRHQLRVHCAALGFPIVGDGLYNNNQQQNDVAPATRMMLHAWRIGIPKDAITLAATGEEESEQSKTRRKEIKQSRKQQQQYQQQPQQQNDDDDENDDEEDETALNANRAFFTAPESLSGYFTFAE